MRITMLRLNQRLALGRAEGATKEQDPMKFSESVRDGRTDKVDYRGASLLKTGESSSLRFQNQLINHNF